MKGQPAYRQCAICVNTDEWEAYATVALPVPTPPGEERERQDKLHRTLQLCLAATGFPAGSQNPLFLKKAG